MKKTVIQRMNAIIRMMEMGGISVRGITTKTNEKTFVIGCGRKTVCMSLDMMLAIGDGVRYLDETTMSEIIDLNEESFIPML